MEFLKGPLRNAWVEYVLASEYPAIVRECVPLEAREDFPFTRQALESSERAPSTLGKELIAETISFEQKAHVSAGLCGAQNTTRRSISLPNRR
jgi:hypothetical protein